MTKNQQANKKLSELGFSIGEKVKVFDSQKWMKTGDIGDNSSMWIDATINGCSINDYKELLINVIMADGETQTNYYKEGIKKL